jgi:release factor glutamine methyltransferase
MTIHEARQQLLFRLYDLYDNREAAHIADWVMEKITGWKKIDRIINKQLPLLPDTIVLLEKYTNELLAYKPVQYVLHEAWFYGMNLFVDENVLIPRPETEELVEWVIEDVGGRKYEERNMKKEAGGLKDEERSTKYEVNILDIGTGSGCIPIVLKKKLPGTTVYACDVSPKALEVAIKNSVDLQIDIHYIQADFLDKNKWSILPAVDIIVSNPPYIPQQDKLTMSPNVLQYEPHLALFVENNDPLLFYKAIADFGSEKLLTGGAIYVEIHEDLGEKVYNLFVSKGFTTELKKDLQGKDRMIKANRFTE